MQAAAVGCLDVNLLVNNAGLFTNHRLVLTDDPDAARREMEVNYFGVLNMTRALSDPWPRIAALTRAHPPALRGGHGTKPLVRLT